MRKKRNINAKVLKDLGLEPPTRVVRKQKPSPYHKPGNTDRGLDDVYEALKKILVPSEKKLVAEEWSYDNGEEIFPTYMLYIPAKGDLEQLPFLGVSRNRGNITFHLNALVDKKVEKLLPKALELHRHGQTVLNFTEIDNRLFKQLAKLVADLIRMAEQSGYL